MSRWKLANFTYSWQDSSKISKSLLKMSKLFCFLYNTITGKARKQHEDTFYNFIYYPDTLCIHVASNSLEKRRDLRFWEQHVLKLNLIYGKPITTWQFYFDGVKGSSKDYIEAWIGEGIKYHNAHITFVNTFCTNTTNWSQQWTQLSVKI